MYKPAKKLPATLSPKNVKNTLFSPTTIPVIYNMLTSILKYAGLLLAAVSSIWGIRADVTRTVNGRKQLTREGNISILLALAGFLISVVSTGVEDYQHQAEKADELKADIRKTNRIILAGQALTSLSLTWNFPGSDKATLARIDSGDRLATKEISNEQGERSSSENAPWIRYRILFPFLQSLCKDTSGIGMRSFLLLLALDNTQNSVLPLGFLRDSVRFEGKKLDSLHGNAALPVGVETEGSITEAFGGGGNSLANHPNLLVLGSDTVSIGWNLNAYTFMNAINRQITSITTTANLPDTIRIAMIYDFNNLPFSNTNFSLSPDYGIWTDETDDGAVTDTPDSTNINRRLLFHSSITLVPNDFQDQSITYNFLSATPQFISEREYGEPFPCKALILVFARRPEK